MPRETASFVTHVMTSTLLKLGYILHDKSQIIVESPYQQGRGRFCGECEGSGGTADSGAVLTAEYGGERPCKPLRGTAVHHLQHVERKEQKPRYRDHPEALRRAGKSA